MRDGDEWVINGHKWFTSNGSVADFLIVMAVTNPDVHPYQGCSMIVVPADTPGVDIVRDVPTMEDPVAHFGQFGGHAEIVYRDVRVPVENLVGSEGEGFRLAQKRLGPGRIHHCMRWLGQSRRAFDMLCERAVSRTTHGSLLAEKQTIQNWVADSMAEMTAARLMTLQAAWKMDQEGASAARVEIAMIKYYGAGVLYNVIDRAIQVHGSLGFSTDLPLEHMYRARPGGPHLRRARRGAQGHRGPPDPEALHAGRGPDRARAHPPGRGPAALRPPAGGRDGRPLTGRAVRPAAGGPAGTLVASWPCSSISSSVAVRRVDRALFEDLSLTVSDGDRVGVVGINGTGKSTLLRTIRRSSSRPTRAGCSGAGVPGSASSTRCRSSRRARCGRRSGPGGRPSRPSTAWGWAAAIDCRGRHPVRGPGQAGGPGPGAGPPDRTAGAGRAHQPPRPGRGGLAGAAPGRLARAVWCWSPTTGTCSTG